MSPPQIQRSLQTALAHHQAGRLAEADRLYRQVSAVAPKLFDPLHLSGVIAYQKRNYDEAIALFGRALRVDPKSALCEMRLGLALAATGRHREAEAHYRSSARRDGKIPETWNNLAVTLKALGQMTEAAECYQKAIALKPDYYDAIDRLGALLADLRGLAAGLPFFRRAVELKPDYAPGWCNLGLVLNAEGKFSEALDCFSRALAADPKLAQAHIGRGLAFQQNYQLPEALEAFASALAVDPRHYEARSARLLTLNYLSGRSRSEDFAEHLAFGSTLEQPVSSGHPKPKTQNPKTLGNRLRVAFLSPDLRNHSVLYFVEPLLRHLDRQQFEVILYHDHFQVDAGSARLRELASVWRNFVGQSHDTVEATVRADAPDIIVDLAGHTGFNRLPLFARRLAPVQVSYLGYPNTTGLREMDFRLVDAITDPDEADQAFYTEKLIRFAPSAWTYQAPVNAPEPRTAEAGRPITFGSFNNFAKVSDETLRLWARVLNSVPTSILLLKAHRLDDSALANVLNPRLEAAGMDLRRVKLLGRAPDLACHLGLYGSVDIALDSFPYHGTTTTCEALWMGVPVVTLAGDRHAARVSASLLTAIGRGDWVAHDPQHYLRIAQTLASDSSQRANLRMALREEMRRSVLCDHVAQATRFGQALRQCWEEKHP
jgi:protein O-GlcNAc transferase